MNRKITLTGIVAANLIVAGMVFNLNVNTVKKPSAHVSLSNSEAFTEIENNIYLS
jgi:hypothetical protein